MNGYSYALHTKKKNAERVLVRETQESLARLTQIYE